MPVLSKAGVSPAHQLHDCQVSSHTNKQHESNYICSKQKKQKRITWIWFGQQIHIWQIPARQTTICIKQLFTAVSFSERSTSEPANQFCKLGDNLISIKHL